MISEHQPTIFPEGFRVVLSSVEDGNMKFASGVDANEVWTNRELFLKRNHIDIERTNLVRISYDSTDFRRYGIAPDEETGVSMHDWHDTKPRDALATGVEGSGLFLPIADCCALVLVDTALKCIMLSHIGRHSAEQGGAAASVEFMREKFGSKPEDILAWLSPAVGKASYPLHAFDGKGLSEVIVEQLHAAGVRPENIEVSPIDTATDDNYFSHSEFKRGHQPSDGRQAVAVMIEAPKSNLLH